MGTTRSAITVFDEDVVLTLLRPYLKEDSNKLVVIYEDSFGELVGFLEDINDLRNKLNLSDDEFNEILLQLE